jgi:hypothetical protein
MYLLIIDNSESDNKQFVVRKLARPYQESILEIIKDHEIIWMIINIFVQEFDDDPNGYYVEESGEPSVKKFKKSLSIPEFYNKAKKKLDYIIHNKSNFVLLESIEIVQ